MDLTGLEGISEESDVVPEWRESRLQLRDMPMNLRERERERGREGGRKREGGRRKREEGKGVRERRGKKRVR